MSWRWPVVLWFVLFTACATEQWAPGAASEDAVGMDEVAPGLQAGTRLSGFDDFGSNTTAAGKDRQSPPAAGASERLLIQRGQVAVEVARPEVVAKQFLERVVAWGGHLQKQSSQQFTVRLPAQHFEAAFEWLRACGRVLAESRQADDVTEEFVDLGLRIDTARKARERLLEVLQKAEKVEDILKVEAELRRLTEEIERMEGRRKFLADQVAMATLQAQFQATAEPPPPPKRARQPSRFWWLNSIGAERVREDF